MGQEEGWCALEEKESSGIVTPAQLSPKDRVHLVGPCGQSAASERSRAGRHPILETMSPYSWKTSGSTPTLEAVSQSLGSDLEEKPTQETQV